MENELIFGFFSFSSLLLLVGIVSYIKSKIKEKELKEHLKEYYKCHNHNEKLLKEIQLGKLSIVQKSEFLISNYNILKDTVDTILTENEFGKEEKFLTFEEEQTLKHIYRNTDKNSSAIKYWFKKNFGMEFDLFIKQRENNLPICSKDGKIIYLGSKN